MKSSTADLESRGYISQMDFEKCIFHDSQDIYHHLTQAGSIRTAAVRRIRADKDPQFIPKLVELLRHEKKLYTKIELCECLAEFGLVALDELIPYLGKIGNNQHKVIGNYDLQKKSYPLPRDIVARIIIRMGPNAFPQLKHVLDSKDHGAISEAIDAVGHISVNYRDYSMEKICIRLYHARLSSLIEWKLIRAFQAFGSDEVIHILRKICEDHDMDIIMRNEAQRSLLRIGQKDRFDPNTWFTPTSQ